MTKGSVALQASGYSDPSCQLPDIIVFKNSGGTYTALSAGCDHACCTAAFKTTQIRCPCHGATWDLTGKLTGSPARNDLQNLPVCSDATGVYVTLP
jgi:nitrite reductase/ring-hydroxylating ferredoxin subunit